MVPTTHNTLAAALATGARAIVERKHLSGAATNPEKITYRQIAEEMNKPVSTVKSEVSRAMAQMREQHTARRTGIDSLAMAKLG